MKLQTLLFVTAAAMANAANVTLTPSADYFASGQPATVTAEIATDAKASLNVTAIVETYVPARGIKDAVATKIVPLLAREFSADASVPVSFATKDMLAGRVRFNAKLAVNGTIVADTLTDWMEVGVRERLSLAGDWKVLSATPFPVDISRHGFKSAPPDPMPQTMALPTLFSKTAFKNWRGWISLGRDVAWESKDKSPGRLVAEKVADNIVVKIGGNKIAEMVTDAELASFLSHWPYFHGERLTPEVSGREDKNRLIELICDRQIIPVFHAPLPDIKGNSVGLEIELRGTSGLFSHAEHGIHGRLFLEMLPKAHFTEVSFETEKPDERRLFIFSLDVANATSRPFRGKVRTVYGEYADKVPYTGACPPYAEEFHDVNIPAGGGKIEIRHYEVPRFATCRASFLLMDGSAVVDEITRDYHTVTVEIRNRRDMFLNNERFFVKGRGSYDTTPNQRWQMRLNNVNMRRGMGGGADWVNKVYAEGLLHDTGPFLGSCEKCTFWNPDDTGNIERAVWSMLRVMRDCPGIIQWEAFNELYGETEETRLAVYDAIKRMDPYKRPIVMTKGGGEWEAEAKEGRVLGTDIIGVQYLGSREAIDGVTATITEQPIQSTEINWNDPALIGDSLWDYGLDRGICGALLFDYSGCSTDQPGTDVPPDRRDDWDWGTIQKPHRAMYQDMTVTAKTHPDGRLVILLVNRMPFTLRNLECRVLNGGAAQVAELATRQGFEIIVPASAAIHREHDGTYAIVHAVYTTHGGLPHEVVLHAKVEPAQ